MHIVLVEPRSRQHRQHRPALRRHPHDAAPDRTARFRLDDVQLRRAGMDYWQHVEWHRWRDWPACEQALARGRRRPGSSSRAGRDTTPRRAINRRRAGVRRETAGLPRSWLEANPDRWLRLRCSIRPRDRSTWPTAWRWSSTRPATVRVHGRSALNSGLRRRAGGEQEPGLGELCVVARVNHI